MFAAERASDVAHLKTALLNSWTTPSRELIASWVSEVEEAALVDDAIAGLLSDVECSSERSADFVVVGDYSAGKSSLIKRLLVELGEPLPESLNVRADATTNSVVWYDVGQFRLVDTPGFQSGRAGHDAKALEAVMDSALVIVVLHMNLLIGDTDLITGIANGTESAVPKLRRMLFLINRCDELGVDPQSSPRDFLNRRRRKHAELVGALKTHDIPVEAVQVHGLAGDPFGRVGARLDVAADDYAENREWDGIAPLVEVLSALTTHQREDAQATHKFDSIVSRLLRLNLNLHHDAAKARHEAESQASVLRALQAGVDEGRILEGSLKEEARRIVEPYAGEVLAELNATGPDDMHKVTEKVNAWWEDPAMQSDLDHYLASAGEKIDAWYEKHASIIGREFAAAQFDATQPAMDAIFDGPKSPPKGGPEAAVSGGANTMSNLARLLANRETILQIGHALGHKFRPWEAVKMTGRVAKIGPILSMVAVVADGASMVRGHLDRDQRSKTREDATAFVKKTQQLIVEGLLAGVDGEGPLRNLQSRIDDLNTTADSIRTYQQEIDGELALLRVRSSRLTSIIDHAVQIREGDDVEVDR